jgi:hypothetical protein
MSASVLTLIPDETSTSTSVPLPPHHQSHYTSLNEIEFSFSVPHNISRLWYIIRDANLTTLLCPDFFLPLIITKGKDAWGIGTEFQGRTSSSIPFIGKCTKYKSFAQIKKLSWLVYLPHSKLNPFYYEYTLYKVTEDDSSVLLITIRATNIDELNRLEVFFTKKNFFEIVLQRINILMNQSCLNLFQFEGVVIESNMEIIWKFLTHLDQLKKIAPSIPFDGESDNQVIPDTIGNESLLYLHNHTSYVRIKTIKYDTRNNWDKWVVLFRVVESHPVIPKHETLITVNKINKDECHVSWFHDFKEPAAYDFLKVLSSQKKYILQMLQDYLENYLSKTFDEDYCSINTNTNTHHNDITTTINNGISNSKGNTN